MRQPVAPGPGGPRGEHAGPVRACWKRPPCGAAILWLLAGLTCAAVSRAEPPSTPSSAIVSSGFVFEHAPFASAHASTIVETREGLLAAWFGGSDEGQPDVSIWSARHDGARWLPPVLVADGRQPDGGSIPLLEPGPVPAVPRTAAPLLQSGPEPARVVGSRPHVDRPGTHVVGRCATPRRNPRPDPREARRAPGRRARSGVEQRARGLGGPHGARDARGAGRPLGLDQERAAQRPEGVRGDPADDPGALAARGCRSCAAAASVSSPRPGRRMPAELGAR